MKLADISIQRPVGVLILVIAIMILGAVSLTNLSIDLLPNLELPIAVVMTNYSGAAPEEVENLVTAPLEGTLSTVEGLDTVQSISAPNQSVIVLMYDFGTNMDSAMMDIRDRLEMVREMLPESAGEPSVLKFDPNTLPIIQLSFSGDAELAELTTVAEETVQPRLERLPGVAQVGINGKETRVIEVEVDPVELETHQLSMSDLAQLIAAENMNASAGNLSRGSQEMSLRITGEFKRVEDISNINVPLPSGDILKLGELATVRDTFDEPASYAYVNGERTLSLDISKQSDANTVAVANAVQKEVQRLQAELPERMHLNTVYDSAQFIRESIDNVVSTMIIGALMAIFILVLFLRSLRSTLVIAASIPIAIISAFTLIYFSGQTLNLLTMGGLALGIGMMVDSSIIILENISKYRERGYPLIEAAKQGTAEIGSAVIASTLTSVVVFLPIVFTSGIAAEIFMPLALTVTFTLMASLLVALTLVPMLSSRLLPPIKREEDVRGFGRLSLAFGRGLDSLNHGYRRVLSWGIGHRKTVTFVTLLLIVGSLFLIPLIGVEFIPAFDQGEIMVQVDLPAGTNLEKTSQVLKQLEDRLLNMSGVELVFTMVGGDPSGMNMSQTSNTGSIYLRLLPADEREITTEQVIDQITDYGADIPDADVQAFAMQSADMGTSPVSINIVGDDLSTLKTIAAEVEHLLASVDGVTNIANSLDETRSELRVIVDRNEAQAYGLTYGEIMQTVSTAFQGQTATFMRTEGQEIEVNLVFPSELREDIQDLRHLPLMTPFGESIPLSAVAEFDEGQGPHVINRQNQERGVNVTADLLGRDLGSVIAEIEADLASLHVPEGYEVSIGGDYEQMMDTFADLALALILAIFLVYAVMAIQFEKLMYPFIVMFSLPATFIGVVIGLAVTGRPLSAPGFIGLIMLAGIVVNNAIVLIDYINTLRGRGMSREEAILQAGPDRLRPILMTVLTTVLAMFPLSLGIGEGAEMQAPLATVIIFGLSFSTLITLILVPVMYIYMDNLTNWWKSLFRRRRKSVRLNESE